MVAISLGGLGRGLRPKQIWTVISRELDSSYSYLRQFTPGVLAAVDFTGGPGTADLIRQSPS